MDTKEITMPIDKWSYSSLTQLLRNPLIFKLKHILGVYDGKIGVSGLIGQAGHKTLEVYYGGNEDISVPTDKNEARAIALEYGFKFLNDYSDVYIDFGKTGSREGMLKSYTQAMDFYFAEEPEYHEILYVEKKFQAELKTVDGDILPLPAVGKPDLIHRRKDGGVEIIDIKFTKTFTDYEEEDYIKIVQSQFMWHLTKAAADLNADRMLFREVKITKNRPCESFKRGEKCDKRHDAEGCHPQVDDWAIPFSHEQYRVIFYNLYRDATKFVANPDSIYLPNLSDPFDGEQAGLLYAQGLLNSDMSDVEVMHKVKDVAFVSKKFVPSRLENIENRNLDPEEKIKLRLAEFGIPVEPVDRVVGQSVTQYRFKVSRGVRMSTFKKHKDDIARAIEAKGNVNILAPIPGTDLVGVEVANEVRTSIKLGKQHFLQGTMSLPVGVDIHGNVVRSDLREMPHLLIAGATGSGKSILLHSIITALTKQMDPKAMRMVLIDPKRVELSAFAKIKHLDTKKILYDYNDVVVKLTELVQLMEARYSALEKSGARDITEYNKEANFMAYIVVVIDEYADFMIRSKVEEKKRKEEAPQASVEHLITRLAQMARAVGIHLILATQRPSVDVITGLIKSNISCRIALTTASETDSRIILDESGAEKLTGKGDMLLKIPGHILTRVQGFML